MKISFIKPHNLLITLARATLGVRRGSVKQDQHTGQYSDKQYLSHRVSGHPVFLVLLLVCTAMFNHTTSKRLRKAYSAVTRQFF